MPSYRIFLLAEQQVEPFRTRSPKGGAPVLKPRYYEEQGSIDAPHPYAAWKQLQANVEAEVTAARTLGVGDVLVDEEGKPLLLNYWGFDSAQWIENEPVDEPATQAV